MSANEVLGVAENASIEEIRAAYLRKVAEFPPDRSPEKFESIRDAYDRLRDPRRRAKALLGSADSGWALVEYLKGLKPRRIFTGPQAWREVLKTK